MAGDLVSLSYLTTNLAAGRNPTPVSGYDATDVQNVLTPTSGVAISGRMAIFILPGLRVDPFRRTAYVVVSTLDLTADYTLTIDGNDVTVNGPFTDRADLMNQWAAAVNADGTVGAIVVADAWNGYDASGEYVLRVRGTGDYYGVDALTYAFDASATGTAALALSAEAESAQMRLYAQPGHTPIGGSSTADGSASVAWREIAAATATGLARYAIGTGGMCIRGDCSGLGRMAALLTDVTGVPGDGASVTQIARVDLTPCSQETTS